MTEHKRIATKLRQIPYLTAGELRGWRLGLQFCAPMPGEHAALAKRDAELKAEGQGQVAANG